MLTVPNNVVPIRQEPKPQPMADPTYLAIAAASMHEMNRLFEPPKAVDVQPTE